LRYDSVGAFVLQPADGPADGDVMVNTFITQYVSGGGPISAEVIPVRTCVCVCVCMHINLCMCIYLCVYVQQVCQWRRPYFGRGYTGAYMCVCVCVHVCMQISLCMCIHLNVYTCVCVSEVSMSVAEALSHLRSNRVIDIHTYKHTYINTHRGR
jgi:hypothetical protein